MQKSSAPELRQLVQAGSKAQKPSAKPSTEEKPIGLADLATASYDLKTLADRVSMPETEISFENLGGKKIG